MALELAAEHDAVPQLTEADREATAGASDRNKRAEHGRREKARKRVQRAPKPQDHEQVQRDAVQIGSMLSRGFDPSTIRRSMSLSRRQWDARMTVLIARSRDRNTIWAKYRASTRSNLRMLATVRERCLESSPPAFNAAIRAIQAASALQEREIVVGQSLGEYRRVTPEGPAGDGNDGRPDLLGITDSEQHEDEYRQIAEDALRREEPIVMAEAEGVEPGVFEALERGYEAQTDDDDGPDGLY
jgi:hypothetical protein